MLTSYSSHSVAVSTKCTKGRLLGQAAVGRSSDSDLERSGQTAGKRKPKQENAPVDRCKWTGCRVLTPPPRCALGCSGSPGSPSAVAVSTTLLAVVTAPCPLGHGLWLAFSVSLPLGILWQWLTQHWASQQYHSPPQSRCVGGKQLGRLSRDQLFPFSLQGGFAFQPHFPQNTAPAGDAYCTDFWTMKWSEFGDLVITKLKTVRWKKEECDHHTYKKQLYTWVKSKDQKRKKKKKAQTNIFQPFTNS